MFLLQITVLGYLFFMAFIQWRLNRFLYWPQMRFFGSRFQLGSELSDDGDTAESLSTSVAINLQFQGWEVNNTSSKYFLYFAENFRIKHQPVVDWITRRHSQCGDKFVGYAKNFASLRNVVIDPLKCRGNRGGENMTTVMNQSENTEYLKFTKGFFSLVKPCDKMSEYTFLPNNHLNTWMKNVVADNSIDISSNASRKIDTISQLTLAVQRYEYVNLYHTMTDWYNVFLMLMVFHVQPSNVTILFIDGHPAGGLDHVWTGIFHDVIRAAHLPRKTHFERLVWATPGYFSMLMKHSLKEVPYLNEFRHFFATSLGVNTTHVLDCKQISILFIWRHDYIAHPRNPNGQIARKIKNEKELVRTMKEKYPNYIINDIQPDLYSVPDQLEYVTKTDILIGMHGAGLSLTLFLPNHAALIEMFPKYSSQLLHFRAMATWRRLNYKFLKNMDVAHEFANFYTYIPPSKLLQLTSEAIESMCKH